MCDISHLRGINAPKKLKMFVSSVAFRDQESTAYVEGAVAAVNRFVHGNVDDVHNPYREVDEEPSAENKLACWFDLGWYNICDLVDTADGIDGRNLMTSWVP